MYQALGLWQWLFPDASKTSHNGVQLSISHRVSRQIPDDQSYAGTLVRRDQGKTTRGKHLLQSHWEKDRDPADSTQWQSQGEG
jgi:hypothetical protein